MMQTMITACLVVLATGALQAQETAKPVPAFTVVSRQFLAGSHALSIRGEDKEGQLLYHIEGQGIQARVPALSQVDVAGDGSRIWVYGDTLARHAAPNGYACVYRADGTLVQSLGLLATRPYVAAVAGNGAMAFAGKTSQTAPAVYSLLLFDADGHQRLSINLPDAMPAEVFVSDDDRYVAVSLFFTQEYRLKTLVYDNAGNLLYTHPGNIDGIAFLPSEKMVVCNGNSWSLLDMASGFRQLASGILPGVAVGRLPVIAPPSGKCFFLLSRGASEGQVSLQAYDAANGAMLAQSSFEGKGYRQRYRLLQMTRDGNLQLRTEQEVITLHMQ